MILKQQVDDLLRKRDFARLIALCANDRRVWQTVRMRLYDLDETCRWPAIETIAMFMRQWWDAGKEEKVRQYIRTLFWSITDESGGIGWSAPQTIAEIIVRIPELIDPYGSMMIAHCIDEPPLLSGCFWGIGRLGGLIGKSVKVFQNEILEVFNINDSNVIGTATWAMGETGFAPATPFLQKLSLRSEPVTIYIEGSFYEKPLGTWAVEALAKVQAVK